MFVSATFAAEFSQEMGQMIEALHEVEADFDNLCRQHSKDWALQKSVLVSTSAFSYNLDVRPVCNQGKQ